MIAWPFHVILRPRDLVGFDGMNDGRGWIQTSIEGTRLLVIYSLSLVLYAAPLTLTGIGVSGDMTAPKFVESLLTNSAFLLVATLLIFITFHVGVLISGKSNGILRSLEAVAYSTGIYLALAYTLVWFVATTPQTRTASNLLLMIQGRFFYYFIELFNVNLELPGGRPSAVDPSSLTPLGEGVLILLVLAGVYTLYVLYIGSRAGHKANRAEALIATTFVMISPALYAIGTILYSLYL